MKQKAWLMSLPMKSALLQSIIRAIYSSSIKKKKNKMLLAFGDCLTIYADLRGQTIEATSS